MKFYHLSRCGSITSKVFEPCRENIEITHLWDQSSGFHFSFPFLSYQGLQYLTSASKLGTVPIGSSVYYELRLDFIRRTISERFPSRMQSLFACKSIEDMWKITESMEIENGVYPVYSVSGSNYMELDMSLVNPLFQHSIDWRFQAYWKGCSEHPPCSLPEVIIELPVINEGLETVFFVFKPSVTVTNRNSE